MQGKQVSVAVIIFHIRIPCNSLYSGILRDSTSIPFILYKFTVRSNYHDTDRCHNNGNTSYFILSTGTLCTVHIKNRNRKKIKTDNVSSPLHTPNEQYADKGNNEYGEGHYAPHEAEVWITVFHIFIGRIKGVCVA